MEYYREEKKTTRVVKNLKEKDSKRGDSNFRFFKKRKGSFYLGTETLLSGEKSSLTRGKKKPPWDTRKADLSG